MLSGTLGALLIVSAAVAGAAGNAPTQREGARRPGVQTAGSPTREWAIGRWYLEQNQCRGRSFLILYPDGTYVLEEFDEGTWTLSGNALRREPRLMYLGDGLTRPELYGRIVPTTDRIDYVDARRMTYTVGSSGFRGMLTRCG